LDLPSKLHETPYLGVLYIILIIASLLVALDVVGKQLCGQVAPLAIGSAPLLGYISSRWIGLPGATGDIGNWLEPLGLASIFVEGAVVVLIAHSWLADRKQKTPTETSLRAAQARRRSTPSSIKTAGERCGTSAIPSEPAHVAMTRQGKGRDMPATGNAGNWIAEAETPGDPRMYRWWRFARTWRLPLVVASALTMLAAVIGASTSPAGATRLGASPNLVEFNDPGNILIADQFNNRVIELDRHHRIVWQYGVGPTDFTPRSIVGTNDAQRVGPFTLIAGTGIPPNTVPTCTAPSGCPDNRVILVDPFGHIVWQYGHFGVAGSGPDQLNTPVQNTWLPNAHILITDQANERVIEVDLGKRIVWQYGTTGVTGTGPNELNNPNSAELLSNGHILIADENNNRAIEVTRDHKIVATFTAGSTVSGAAFASRLPNGDTLVTDSNNNRVVEVDRADHIVWQYPTNTDPGSNPNPLPTRAVRLANGDTLISDQFNDRVIEVSTAKAIVFQIGTLNQAGIGGGLLNGPYDAKAIGDYTGLTPPFGSF
jgi:hypothetical protein